MKLITIKAILSYKGKCSLVIFCLCFTFCGFTLSAQDLKTPDKEGVVQINMLPNGGVVLYESIASEHNKK